MGLKRVVRLAFHLVESWDAWRVETTVELTVGPLVASLAGNLVESRGEP